MDTQKIQSTLEFKAFMNDLMEKSPEEIIKMPDETFQKFLKFCKELISDFNFPFCFFLSYQTMLTELEDEENFWVDLIELEADMKCRIYPGTKFDLPDRGRLKHALEHDGKTFLAYLLSACGKTINFLGCTPDTKNTFPPEKIVQWTPLMKFIRKLGIG